MLLQGIFNITEASIAAFGAAAGVAIALAIVCFILRGKGHSDGSHIMTMTKLQQIKIIFITIRKYFFIMKKTIQIKRVYEKSTNTDGYRILVDRLWLRGISKERAKVNLWIKEITPSNDLRQWYHDNLEKRDQFQKKYLAEIERNLESLNEIKKIIYDQKIITLLSASKDTKPIHAIVLQKILSD